MHKLEQIAMVWLEDLLVMALRYTVVRIEDPARPHRKVMQMWLLYRHLLKDETLREAVEECRTLEGEALKAEREAAANQTVLSDLRQETREDWRGFRYKLEGEEVKRKKDRGEW